MNKVDIDKVDILVLMAHPDDAELCCGGTILAHLAKGYRLALVDFTAGELGTRGNAETRLAEAARAAEIMGVTARENMGFRDGFFRNDETHQRALIQKIRRFRPEIVIANATDDRHPDHGEAAQLSRKACFLSGLKRIETKQNGKTQAAWRPKQLYHVLQSRYMRPDFSVDVSAYWEQKMAAIFAYKSQFHTEPAAAKGDQTFISTPAFLKFIESRAHELGHNIGVAYAEGFTAAQPLGIHNLFDLR